MHQACNLAAKCLSRLKNFTVFGAGLLVACGQQVHQAESFDSKSTSVIRRRSKFEQGLRYLDEGLHNKAMIGDETTRRRRWRLQWDPGKCTAPQGPALQITTQLDNFDSANAYWLSWLSIQAYRQLEANEDLRRMGLNKVDFISDNQTSFQAFVGSNEKYVIVSFAGTSDFVDYLTDVTFASKGEFFPGIPGRVHTGFLNVLEKSWPQLIEMIKNHSTGRKPIILTGHSLGGAQAVISATRLAVMGFPVDSLYIYSVPRIGDETYAKYVSRLFPNRIYRFVNNEDVVPRLPPPRVAAEAFSKIFPEDSREPVRDVFEALQYTHVGQLLIQNSKGQLLAPRDFAEDEDVDYWSNVLERSRGRSLPAMVFTNWRMLFDHIPFASHCQLKAPKAPTFVQATDFLD